MLLDEPPITVYPSLAKALGNVNKALILQQLHYLLNVTETADKQYNFVGDKWWVYNTYEEWQNFFSWLSISAIKGLFGSLEKAGLVLSMQGVKDKWDRRKWYTLDYEAFTKFVQSNGQNLSHVHQTKFVPSKGQKMSGDNRNAKTTPKTTNKEVPRKRSPLPIKFPSNVRSYTTKHVAAYQEQHATELKPLIQAWAGNMYVSLTEFSNRIAHLYIETYQELERLHIPCTDYPELVAYTRKKDAWKGGGKITDLLSYTHEYQKAPKSTTNGATSQSQAEKDAALDYEYREMFGDKYPTTR